MNERIKSVRKKYNLSQEEFGNKIRIGRSSVAKLESGENNPSEQTIELICKNFRVNREWLLNGFGEPYKSEKGAFSEILSDLEDSDDDFIKDLISVYMELDDASKAALRKLADGLAKKRGGQN